MTENGLTLNASSAYIADRQNIFITDDFVEVAPVPFSDRMACADGRFVQPTGEWPSAEAKLRAGRVVVLKGLPWLRTAHRCAQAPAERDLVGP